MVEGAPTFLAPGVAVVDGPTIPREIILEGRGLFDMGGAVPLVPGEVGVLLASFVAGAADDAAFLVTVVLVEESARDCLFNDVALDVDAAGLTVEVVDLDVEEDGPSDCLVVDDAIFFTGAG